MWGFGVGGRKACGDPVGRKRPNGREMPVGLSGGERKQAQKLWGSQGEGTKTQGVSGGDGHGSPGAGRPGSALGLPGPLLPPRYSVFCFQLHQGEQVILLNDHNCMQL